MQEKELLLLLYLSAFGCIIYLSIFQREDKELLHFENEFAGLTILTVLTSKLGFSKKAITALKKKEDGILLNGKHATVRAKICAGDTLTINCDDGEDEQNEKLVPSATLPDIIFEDEDIVVANKPANMPTHPSHNHFDDTLANSLAYYYKLQDRPFVFRSVNRLDRNTSGAVLVAKNKRAAYKLGKAMKEDKIKKEYLAILCGRPKELSGTIKTHIRRKEKSIIFREICSECDDSKLAITDYKVIAQSDALSLVVAAPVTGRTHQLRLHFAHIGCPILGDDLYGKPSDLIPRHALHAYKLSFEHPTKNTTVNIFADVPEDIKNIIIDNFNTEDIKHES